MEFIYGEAELAHLRKRDAKLSAAIDRIGHVSRETESDLFTSVIHQIIGQQISMSAQRTVWKRFCEAVGEVTPENVCGKTQEELKSLGMTFRKADYILDTSQMLTRELQSELHRIFVENKEYKNIYVTLLSFGFKYGIPSDADLVFDVRFLPNPYYLEELRHKTGNDIEVRDFVMKNETAEVFVKKLEDMIRFLIPNYITEGKHQLVIAIGCTGGKHRSVTIANELYSNIKADDSFGIKVEHRDIEKDAKRKK